MPEGNQAVPNVDEPPELCLKSTNVEGPTVRRTQRPPKFPVNMWNHYQDALNKASKTANCTEGCIHGRGGGSRGGWGGVKS